MLIKLKRFKNYLKYNFQIFFIISLLFCFFIFYQKQADVPKREVESKLNIADILKRKKYQGLHIKL